MIAVHESRRSARGGLYVTGAIAGVFSAAPPAWRADGARRTSNPGRRFHCRPEEKRWRLSEIDLAALLTTIEHPLSSSAAVVSWPRQVFDVVMVGAALEHVPLDISLERLARLLRPGGLFLNLGMRPGPSGAMLGRLYRLRPYTTGEIRRLLERLGFVYVHVLRLMPTDFPANLTRIAVTGRKA